MFGIWEKFLSMQLVVLRPYYFSYISTWLNFPECFYLNTPTSVKHFKAGVLDNMYLTSRERCFASFQMLLSKILQNYII